MKRQPVQDGQYHLTRRRILAASAATTASLTGCTSTDDDPDNGDEPTTENPAEQPVDTDDRTGTGPTAEFIEKPPGRVYLPTHQDRMQMLPMERAGDYQVMPHWSYSHTVWLVRGTETTREGPGGKSLHFMFMIWDGQTEQLLPVNVAGPMRVYRDGSLIGRPGRPWPIISQGMGFHSGDSRQFASDGHGGSLPEEDRYEIELQFRPISVRKTGQFAGRFEEPVTATFEFEFTQQQLETINERTEMFNEQRRGSAAAAEPMSGGEMG